MFSSFKNRDFVKVKNFEDLKAYYGKDTISLWESVGDATIPLKKDNQNILRNLSDECCVGMSLDFISNYLKEIKAGNSPIDAIKSISSRFKNGASKEAELSQIFYNYLDTSGSVEDLQKKAIEQYVEKRKREISTMPVSFDEFKLDNIFKNFFEEFLSVYFVKNMRFITQKLGLGIDIKASFPTNFRDKDSEDHFKAFVQNLPNGVYQIVVPMHSLCFIKTDNDCYIFDPDIGIFKTEIEKNDLFNLYKNYVFRSTTHFVYFYKYELL